MERIMAKLTYYGHSAFLLETGNHGILIDPFLTGNPLAPVKAEQVKCNFIIVTHGHGDHVGDAVAIAKRNKATIIANYEIATWCGWQGVTAHPMQIGGAHEFPFGRVKLTIAHHGSGLEKDKNFIYLGNPAGVLITVEGKTIYHAGDTGLFYDMKLIGEMNAIDVALLPIGDNFTMGIDDAVKAVEFLNPKLVIPMHYNTFEVIAADPNVFVQKVKAKGYQAQVLQPGDHVKLS
jgi:L-ascorbate metabolism protein UlaG (beta-lactamase superfamily)